jgi:hypothetical protein
MTERITFDRSLYLPEAVEAAAAAYAEHAKIELTATGEAVTAVITEVADHDPKELVHTFCNHVLHETITRRRQVAVQEIA